VEVDIQELISTGWPLFLSTDGGVNGEAGTSAADIF
jgi:hypothetical protein